MDLVLRGLLVLAALIHLLPVAGVLGGPRFQVLYGITVTDGSVAILLQHRALLFAIVGLLLLGGAVHAPWRWPALLAGLISVIGFLAIAGLDGGGNPALARVARVDLVALASLLVVLGHDVWTHLRTSPP